MTHTQITAGEFQLMAINLKIWQVADMKRIGIILALVWLGAPSMGYAAAPPVLRESVAVCDPNAPTHCAAPNSSGALPVTVSGGGGASQITAPLGSQSTAASVAIVSNGSILPGATTTDNSGTITAGGTFQTAIASSSTRKACSVQNPISATETLFVYQGSGTPTTATANGLSPGSQLICNTTEAISVEAATTGHAFVAKSQ